MRAMPTTTLFRFRLLFYGSSCCFTHIPKTLVASSRLICTTPTATASCFLTQVGNSLEDGSAKVFRKWGCSDAQIATIFRRHPSLVNAKYTHLQPKLVLLSRLGLTAFDLVKIVNCRPRFLSHRIDQDFDERLEFLTAFFGSREIFLKAIRRNPSLLSYDLRNKIKSVVDMYGRAGVGREDLKAMIITRPTVIPRSSLTEEKLEYIRRTGCSVGSKLYKYVVTIIAISRLETLREKVANFENFGISDDEVLNLFGRSPIILTLSIDKVQRNMTFVMGTMRLPAKTVLKRPFLLSINLEVVLKPRVLLVKKLREFDLVPQIQEETIFRALRMTEKRFLVAFVTCHPKDVSDKLFEYYNNVKCVKRLAEASKRSESNGFPF